MTVLREALVLPVLLLTVVLFGGMRIADDVRFVPPPLSALVLALLLMPSLVRSGVLRPELLMNAGRTALENLSGLAVLLTLFAASAQAFHVVTPDRGLLHLVFGAFFFIQLLSAMASGTGRIGMLRTLVVLFGSAFVLRWIMLEALYAPDSGTLNRLLTVLAEGITLGTMDYVPHAGATGYTAFAALAIYLAALALLSHAQPAGSLQRVPAPAAGDLRVIGLLACLVLAGACENASTEETPPPLRSAGEPTNDEAIREDALRRAKVWQAPAVPVAGADLSANPPGGFSATDDVACTFELETVSGTTPKFYCRLESGERIKVKYGTGNPELPAELAATRLLAALGFAADRMYAVRTVRCDGCPGAPFPALRCHARTGLAACLSGARAGRVVEFPHAVIERRLPGRKIEAAPDEGWAWYELSKIDPASGGATRAEVDAFRLLAAFLAHWDNKAPNQRLVCPPPADDPAGRCAAPIAMMQDVGASFGPTKLDLRNWRHTPVWADANTCTVSMKALPWNGATFPDARISEEGRRLLAGLLQQLSERQLTDLFVSTGVTAYDQLSAEARDARHWVAAFTDKVRQVADAGPCPG